MDNSNRFQPQCSTVATTAPSPELIHSSMEFLSRSWSPTSFQIAKALSPRLPPRRTAEAKRNGAEPVAENPFTFACSATSQLVMERIMSHSQEVSQLTSGRLSYSSGPMNDGSLSDSPPFALSDWEAVQELPFLAHSFHTLNNGTTTQRKQTHRGESRTLRNWLKDRRKQKEETLAHKTQLDAAVSIAGLAAAVSTITAATASATSIEDDRKTSANLAIASAATLVAAQCIEAAEALGAEQSHLAAAIANAVDARTPGDIVALTTSAASALRGAEMMKARVFKEMWNIAAVIPVEKGYIDHGSRYCDGEGGGLSGEIMAEESFMGLWSLELIARGAELLTRSRTGALHWRIVSVYISKKGHVKLKTKSRHVVGTITNNKKNVIEVWKDVPAWPGRHLLEGGMERRYFGLKTMEERVVEFECRGQREYEMWTHGVSRLLSIVSDKARGVP